MTLTIGELFAGYGGLGLGLSRLTSVDTRWVSDVPFDRPGRGACKVLADRFPDAPNLGDIRQIDWSNVEPVDVVTGGSPCQDLSHAGRRAGMREDTRSGLWFRMAEGIDALQPKYVVWENVNGAKSAKADSNMDIINGGVGPNLRALGRVLGDLSALGYDAGWTSVRASEVGAPHQRSRVFVLARRRDEAPFPIDLTPPGWTAETGLSLPTPTVNDMGARKTLEWWDDFINRMKSKFTNGNGHGRSLAIELQRDDFSEAFDEVITRWEAVTGMTAPDHRDVDFYRWMMGLPDHWLDAADPEEQRLMCGNGVVPLQAAAAVTELSGLDQVTIHPLG